MNQMTTVMDAPSSALEDELANALDEIVAALVISSGDAEIGSASPVQAYLAGHKQITQLIEKQGKSGVHMACLFMEDILNVLLQRAGPLQTNEYHLLESWPYALVACCDSNPDLTIASDLLDHLSSSVWPNHISQDQRDVLCEMLVSANSQGLMSLQEISSEDAGVCADESVSDVTLTPPESLIGEPLWLREQNVSGELLDLLSNEMCAICETLEALATENAAEAENLYFEEICRLAVAAEAVGLSALHHFFCQFDRKNLSHGCLADDDAQKLQLLGSLPKAIQSYLENPGEIEVAEALVALLRSANFTVPISPEEGDLLVSGLCLVAVTREAAMPAVRQAHATEDDVSLSLPEDIPQELLSSLLQELPVQTEEFSNSIQRLVGGLGSFDDMNVAKRSAHTLKGAANTVGLRGIANLTHHLEDILIALSAKQCMPTSTLGDALVRAADCLEAMSEAVIGSGPEPSDKLSVLQEILNWANCIDNDNAFEHNEEPESTISAPEAQVAATTPEGEPIGPTVRVSADLIDELLRLVGEGVIAIAQIRDRLTKSVAQNSAMDQQTTVLLKLASELEEAVDAKAVPVNAAAQNNDRDFDPLEFERYSTLHTISRRMIESATDTRDLGRGMHDYFSQLSELVDLQDRLHKMAQSVVLQTRMVRVSTVLSRLQRGVRQACRLLDKEVALHVDGSSTLMDGNVLNELIDPLMHVLRNAVDHGVEPASVRQAAGKSTSGNIYLSFSREGNQVVVRCRDDGAGLDFESIERSAKIKGLLAADQVVSESDLSRLILTPGFSTQEQVTHVSGRGIGMDIVLSRIRLLKGTVALHSDRGRGLTVELRLPVALISTHAIVLRAGGKTLAVSSHGIQDIQYANHAQIFTSAGSAVFRLGDQQLPVSELNALLNLPADRATTDGGGFPLLITRLDSGTLCAIKAHELLHSRDIVVKSLGYYVPKLPGVIGATVLGDGSVVPVLDLTELIGQEATTHRRSGGHDSATGRIGTEINLDTRPKALVVDDSLSARRATAQFMQDSGFDVRTSIDGLDAASKLESWQPDIILVDMEMPGMNGLELTTHVRSSQTSLATVPIIMISSRSTTKHRKQAESAGVNAYFVKPFAEDALMASITELTAK